MSLLSKLAKSVKKRIVPAAIGFLTGGPAGAIAGALGSSPTPRVPTTTSGLNALIPQASQPRQIKLPPLGTPVAAGGMIPNLPAIIGNVGRAVAGGARAIPGAGTVVSAGRALVPAARGLMQRYPRSTRALRNLGLFAAGSYVIDQAGNIVGRRAPAKRINPLNHRAAMRAARRIKAVTKLCRKIESSLPKRRVACAPGGFPKRRKSCR